MDKFDPNTNKYIVDVRSTYILTLYFKDCSNLMDLRAGPKEKPNPKSVITHSFYSLSETTPFP